MVSEDQSSDNEIDRSKRDINKDNLTEVERSIIKFMLSRENPVSVKEIAEEMYGSDVKPEATGHSSIRTIRNALRIPKDMKLIEPVYRGVYKVSDELRERGLEATFIAAKILKESRRR